jgi:hypothetical protein
VSLLQTAGAATRTPARFFNLREKQENMLTAAATIQISDRAEEGAPHCLPLQFWHNVQFEPALQDDTDAWSECSPDADFLHQPRFHDRRRNARENSGEWM